MAGSISTKFEMSSHWAEQPYGVPKKVMIHAQKLLKKKTERLSILLFTYYYTVYREIRIRGSYLV